MFSLQQARNLGTTPIYHNSFSPYRPIPTSCLSMNHQTYPHTKIVDFNNTQSNNYSNGMCPSEMHILNTTQIFPLMNPMSNMKINQKVFKKMNYKKKTEKEEKLNSKDSKATRKKFSPEEDEKLKELVEKMGSKKWELIAKEMPGRTGRQCRDRYQNYLIPGFFNGQWSREEDDLLQRKYMEYGSQWSKMKVFFTNRSANALKNRWNYFVSRNMHILPSQTKTIPSNERYQNFNNDIDNIVADDKSSEKDDAFYDNIINYTSSLAFLDLEPVNENDAFICKDEYSGFPFLINE